MVQWLRHCTANGGGGVGVGMGSIPGQLTKIHHAVQSGQKIKNLKKNFFNKKINQDDSGKVLKVIQTQRQSQIIISLYQCKCPCPGPACLLGI